MIANANNKKNIIPLIQRHTNHPEIVRIRSYIENHPNKNSPLFKKSMIIILQAVLNSL